MEKIIDFQTFNNLKPSVVTIGTFDGVHLGHQKIIKRLQNVAKEKGLQSVILTFFPHPRMVLQHAVEIKLLNTIEERQELLSHLGLDHLVIKKFTKEFARLSPEQYVRDILVKELNAKHIIIGYDHRFGKNRRANIKDLITFGKQFGFKVEEISVQDVEDVAVSSTKIRTALNRGDVKTANAFLGYDYFLTGRVIKGKQIGKQIGFPTANIEIKEDYKLIPKTGSYVVKSYIEDNLVYGMMNIGTNPTVDGTKQSIEIHFFNFNQDLYNKRIKIELLDWLREERKFESLEHLQSQLKIDKVNALKVIEKKSPNLMD
ncbi:MAG TPA: bifunctional riboflavin kinase/FAD synthetase [Flavobacteriaceae bacterium]